MKPKIIPWIPAGFLLFGLTAGCLHHGGPTIRRCAPRATPEPRPTPACTRPPRLEPTRAAVFTPHQAGLFDKFLAELEIPGYAPPAMPGIRSTQKYWAASLGGIWARSPYLHNGSVRTMEELLTPPAGRPKTFHRGSRVYDPAQMGYTDEGAYLFETTGPGNASTGHDYGATLSAEQKRELIEYLKTL